MSRSTDVEPTPRQREVLEFIQSRPSPPTFREIARHFGIRSMNGVAYHLRELQNKGLLTRAKRRARTIVANQPRPVLPMRGAVVNDGRIEWCEQPKWQHIAKARSLSLPQNVPPPNP